METKRVEEIEVREEGRVKDGLRSRGGGRDEEVEIMREEEVRVGEERYECVRTED